ncbi:hypothetical protein BG005_011587 [Podila minutissima]|nr:hypothetical protein BG005_011587 [Podila minutissima]
MQQPIDDFTQKTGVDQFLSRYEFLGSLNAFAANYEGPAKYGYCPPEQPHSSARSCPPEPPRFPDPNHLETKSKLQKATDRNKDLRRQLQEAQAKLAQQAAQAAQVEKEHAQLTTDLQHARDNWWLVAHQLGEAKNHRNRIAINLEEVSKANSDLQINVQNIRVALKESNKESEKLRSKLLKAEVDLAQTKTALQAATDKNSMDLERQRQEDRLESHQKIMQAEMRGSVGLEKVKKDKQHLERCLEKANEKHRQDTIRIQEAEQRLAEAERVRDQLKAEAQTTKADVIMERSRRLAMDKECASLRDQLQKEEMAASQPQGAMQEDSQVEQQLQESTQLKQVNEDLRKQLAQIEIYVESFIQERHGFRNTTQVTSEVDLRREELRRASNSVQRSEGEVEDP